MPKIISLTESALIRLIEEEIKELTFEEKVADAQKCQDFLVHSIEGLLSKYIDVTKAKWSVNRYHSFVKPDPWEVKIQWKEQNSNPNMPVEKVQQKLDLIAQIAEKNYDVLVKRIQLGECGVYMDLQLDDKVWAYTKPTLNQMAQ